MSSKGVLCLCFFHHVTLTMRNLERYFTWLCQEKKVISCHFVFVLQLTFNQTAGKLEMMLAGPTRRSTDVALVTAGQPRNNDTSFLRSY